MSASEETITITAGSMRAGASSFSMGSARARYPTCDASKQCAHLSWLFLCFTAVTLLWQKLWLVQKFNGLTLDVAVQEAIHDDVIMILLLSIVRLGLVQYQIYVYQQQSTCSTHELPIFANSNLDNVTPSLRAMRLGVARTFSSLIHKYRHHLLLTFLTMFYLALQCIALFGAMQSYICMAEASTRSLLHFA